MIAKFHKNYEQFSRECKKKSFLKAMEEVERFRVGTFPGAPRPRQPDAKKPAAKKDEKDRPKKKQKVERKRSESDTSSSRLMLQQSHIPCPLRLISAVTTSYMLLTFAGSQLVHASDDISISMAEQQRRR